MTVITTLLEVTVLKSENTSLVSEVEGYKKDISIRDEELEKYKMVASMASQRIDEQQGSINRLNEKSPEVPKNFRADVIILPPIE